MWKIVESRELFAGKLTTVRRELVDNPNGTRSEHVFLDGPAISLVVPFLDERTIVLVRQYRHAWRRLSWECPAGHAEPGETPEATARRELAEETGYRAARLERLLDLFPSAKVAAPYTIFRADGLEPGPPHPDADEELEVTPFALGDVRRLVASGELVHGPTLTALFRVFAGS